MKPTSIAYTSLIVSFTSFFSSILPNLYNRYKIADFLSAKIIFIAPEVILIFCILFLIFYLIFLLPNILAKILATLIIILTAVATFLTVNFSIPINSLLVFSIIHTNYQEASEALSYTDVLKIIPYLITPLVATWMLNSFKLKQLSLKLEALSLGSIILVGLLSGFILENYARAVIIKYPPTNILAAVDGYYKIRKNEQYLTSLTDIVSATNPATLSANLPKKLNIIFVIGETARTQNMQIFGYKKETNPYLVKNPNALAYKAISCDTYTIASVPCLLGNTPPSKFSVDSIKYKNVISVFDFVKFNTFFASLQDPSEKSTKIYSSIYNQAKNVETRQEILTNLKGSVALYDEALLPLTKQWLNNPSNYKFIILHTMGSHASYDERYPKAFEKWLPTSKSSTNKAALINAYDNSILYTDYFLNQLLKTVGNEVPTMILFTSDHGESLGETYNGITYWRHGDDIKIAPIEQKSVPLILMFNQKFITTMNLNFTKMKQLSSKTVTSENVFHTLLNCAGISASIIKKELSLCKFK